jgi:hypothetical protein
MDITPNAHRGLSLRQNGFSMQGFLSYFSG